MNAAKRNLRVNFLVHNPDLGGGDRVIAIYAKYLQTNGHAVSVSALKAPKLSLIARAKHFLRTGKDLSTGFTTTHFDNAGVKISVVENKPYLDDHDVPDGDVLIATFWKTAEWANNMSAAKGAKTYFIQGYEARFPYAPAERVYETYRAPLKKIVISNWLDELMREKFRSAPIAKVANSVDAAQFHAPPRQKNKTPCVGFLYSDSTNKGVDVTLKAIELLQQNQPDLKIISFGSSQVSRALPLPKNCDFHHKPAQDKIRDLYAQCDVWMCGSRFEGFHLPPMEAMACRCPVVSTAVGGPEDVIENGVQGHIVPKEDSKALAEKTLAILQSSDADWRRMSDAAYETATRYSWDDAGALFEAALYEIAASDGRL